MDEEQKAAKSYVRKVWNGNSRARGKLKTYSKEDFLAGIAWERERVKLTNKDREIIEMLDVLDEFSDAVKRHVIKEIKILIDRLTKGSSDE